MQHWRTVVLLGAMLMLSGCIQAVDDGNETNAAAEPEPTPVQRSASEAHTCTVGAPTLPLGDQPVCERHEIDIPAAAFLVEFEMEWDNGGNAYSLQVETPSGKRLSEDRGDDRQIELEVTEVEAGTYQFWPRAETVAFGDEIELTVTYHWMELVEGEVEVPEPRIQVDRQGDRWRATMRYVAVGDTGDAVELVVRTINGDVDLVATADDESRADMEVFAWAASEARARELVSAVKIDIGVTTNRIVAEVEEQPQQLNENEGVGADVVVETPATVGGAARTTNGGVTFEDLPFADLRVSSTNGGFEGTLRGYGDLTGSTTNGGFDVDLTPFESMTLELSTTNGGSDIGLKEGSDTGYRLEATTTNGKVTEDMDDASVSGEDNDGTLETSGFSGRSIQVTGSLSSTNGDIHFRGF